MTEQQTLYRHVPHPHIAHNPNHLVKAEQMAGNFNQKFAILLTKLVSTMWATYLFTLLALLGLFGLLGWLNPFVFLLSTWISQQFLQLVFLPILSVSQSVIERKQEIQAEEEFLTTEKIFHDAEEMRIHQDAQDTKLMEMHEDIQGLCVQVGILVVQITAINKYPPKTEGIK